MEKTAQILLLWHSKASPGGETGAKCGNYSVFVIYAVIFSDARVWSRPCSRFIHSFFKSNAIASRNSSARIFAFPLVRNLRKPKSFFSRPKAPSTWMERHRRRWIPRWEPIRSVA